VHELGSSKFTAYERTRVFKTLLEQWKANQEHKRAIAAERWEQEKRWREEDRQESKAREAAEQEKKAREEETYRIIYRAHLDVLQTAATISYVSLTCHEDTWTFLARRAFGIWSPEWLTSVEQDGSDVPGPTGKADFTKDPNLTPGRITKHEDGMQTVEVSGDNLVAILESLWQGAYGRNIYRFITDPDRNRPACGPLHTRISDWLSDLEPGSVSKPGHALVLDERIEAYEPA